MPDRAILFGINNYQHISDLHGCINDVNNIEALLIGTYRFPETNIRKFADQEVTAAAIRDGFAWLYDGARKGDRLVFHFSGHGSYTTSSSADEDLDELLCLYDMDWEESDTYLIDDDLGELTRGAPSGTHLTVILDCCHSGTGTRAVTQKLNAARKEGPKNRQVILESTGEGARGISAADFLRVFDRSQRSDTRSSSPEEEELRNQATFARFVAPPREFEIPNRSRSVVRPLGRSAPTALNHQLLAGAADDQKAADAFIDGKYNGAFSFYLCETAREVGTTTNVDNIMATVAQKLSGSYKQTPQNEGPFGQQILFGASQVSPSRADDIGSVELNAQSESSHPEAGNQASDIRPLVMLDRLLRISETLIGLHTDDAALPVRGIRTGQAADEVIVYVHGISRHNAGYSTPWYEALRPHLMWPRTRSEVLWSHHVNSRGEQQRSVRVAEREAESLAREIENELNQRISRTRDILPPEARQGPTLDRGDRLAIDDFVRYMISSSTRNAIKDEFDRIVRPLLEAGKKIHLVSHSWGTVVAFESLRDMDVSGTAGSVENLFVVGSALSIGAVRRNLFGRIGDGRLPRNVRRMINLDAGGDPVGGPIGDHFDVAREYLGLRPHGCTRIPMKDIALNPFCAHGSYFEAGNTEVNVDVFARHIDEA